MIIPVGERYEQTLVRIQKREGELERTDLVPSLFVPMTGQAEDRRAVLQIQQNLTWPIRVLKSAYLTAKHQRRGITADKRP